MKKLLFGAALILAAVAVNAQAKVELGLKGGLNLANINTDDPLASYNTRTGYHAGLYALVKVANIGIQPELLYSVRGTELSTSIAGAKQEFKQDFVYMDIPVMLKLYTVAGINIQAGPQFGLLMSVDGKVSDGNGGTTTLSKDSYKDADVSAALGLGWDAPFGLNFTARYVLGLSDVNDGSGDEAKNRTFQVSLGYRLFKVGK